MFKVFRDERGFLSLFDSLLAVFLLFMVLIAFNLIVSMETPSLSEENNDFKTSEDVMEIMAMANGRDFSILQRVSFILSNGNNSVSSQREAGKLLDDFFDIYLPERSYSFIEENQLDSKVLSSRGNVLNADKTTVAIGNYGNYSYKLYIFE